jgi:hypothetical protein
VQASLQALLALASVAPQPPPAASAREDGGASKRRRKNHPRNGAKAPASEDVIVIDD